MPQGRTLIFVVVALIVGFGGGFVLRPVIAPTARTVEIAYPAPLTVPAASARGTQYFEAHIDEARRVVAACRDGTARGNECANAETAVITIESKERFRRFRGER